MFFMQGANVSPLLEKGVKGGYCNGFNINNPCIVTFYWGGLLTGKIIMLSKGFHDIPGDLGTV